MSEEAPDSKSLPAHRSEALSDGIYAVAMTLLVIDLKLPEGLPVHGNGELLAALAHVAPKASAWAISFLVLAFFWVGHHRVFSYVRRSDGKLVALNLLQLAFVSLMPFSSSVVGEHGVLLAQVVYSANMVALCIVALLMSRHVFLHPQLGPVPMPVASYRSARVRIVGLMLVSLLAVGLAASLPFNGGGNMAFMLMAVVARISVATERRERARTAAERSTAPV